MDPCRKVRSRHRRGQADSSSRFSGGARSHPLVEGFAAFEPEKMRHPRFGFTAVLVVQIWMRAQHLQLRRKKHTLGVRLGWRGASQPGELTLLVGDRIPHREGGPHLYFLSFRGFWGRALTGFFLADFFAINASGRFVSSYP